jgi:hypothetical protein
MAIDQKTVTLNLRLPSVIHKRLTKAAAESHRSLNAEILARLDDSLVSNWGEFGGQIEIKQLARLVAQHDEVLERIKKVVSDDWNHINPPRASKAAARNKMSKKGEK